MIRGCRACARTTSSPIATIIPVLATVVAGQSELTAMGINANSTPQPSVNRLSAYLPTVWPTCAPTHDGSMFSGGDTLTMCGLSDSRSQGKAARTNANGPPTLVSTTPPEFLGGGLGVSSESPAP